MDLNRYSALFLADGREHLRRCNTELLRWEERPEGRGHLDELFRAFHSLKSSAAAMEYRGIVEVSHAAEQLLDAVRRRELAPSKAVIGLLFQAVDLLDHSLEPATRGEPVADAGPLAESIARLTASATPSAVEAPAEPAPPKAVAVAPPPVERRAGRARVDPARLDELLLDAGELVVARNRLAEVVKTRSDPELEVAAGRIDTLTRRLHAGVLRVRLAPIAELFGRFPRLVRDLGQSLGKTAKLELSGEGIELDRTVIEELVDPLIHLVRNAVDHGIEPAAERAAQGKTPEGRLVLTAERRRDVVAIRLNDDGQGVNPRQVARRAVELGLLPGDSARLDAEELLAILARPGFTLKEAVTSVSGRGVGMDVVVSRVRALGGRVELRTAVGRGCTFEITVPLTTAVQRVLLVTARRERYAVPFRMVREAVLTGRGGDGQVTDSGFSFRGRCVPFIDLAGVAGRGFGRDGGRAGRGAGGGGGGAGGGSGGRDGAGRFGPASSDRRPVLLLEWGSRGGALGVDSLLGQHDVLLERIEAPASLPAWVSGATILGDGSPAFVLDPTALF